MFYKYEFRDYYGRNALYLYLTMNDEIASELGNDNSDKITHKVKNYIKNKNIDYNGEEVFLVVNGIVVKSINLKNKEINIEVLDDKCSYVNIKYNVKIVNNNKERIINLKDYLLGVLFANNIYNMPKELVKAVCVLYRTYTFYRMEKDGFLDINDNFMKYRNVSYYKLFLIEDYLNIYNKLEEAINETDCIFITYNNEYIKPYIHNTNNGFTEEIDNIPYLEKRESLWDLLSPNYLNIKEFSYDMLEKLLNVSKEELQNIKILELTSGNKIKKIKIGPIIYSGEEFRNKLKLNSNDITILINDYNIKFVTRGDGNGLGLSLSGGMELARSNCNFLQILNYYFPKCTIKKYV